MEPTSGNTGIGIACVAAGLGYKCALVMPAAASVERRIVMMALGAEVHLTNPQKVIPEHCMCSCKARTVSPGKVERHPFRSATMLVSMHCLSSCACLCVQNVVSAYGPAALTAQHLILCVCTGVR